MFWLMALTAFAAGSLLTWLLLDVFYCDPLRRQTEELRLQLVRKDLRAAADRFGYIDYRLQHKGTPYVPKPGEKPHGYLTAPGPWRYVPLDDNDDHSKSAELRAV